MTQKQLKRSQVVASGTANNRGWLCLWLLLSITAITPAAYSQSPATEKMDYSALLEEALIQRHTNPTKSVALAEQISAFSKSPEIRVKALNLLGEVAKKQNHFEAATQYHLRAINELSKVKDVELKASTYLYAADALRFLKRTEDAITYTQRAIELAKKHQLTNRLMTAYKIEGNVYKSATKYKQSLNSFLKLVQLAEKENKTDLLADAYDKAAAAYHLVGQWGTAAEFEAKALNIEEQPANPNKLKLGQYLVNLSMYSRKTEDFSSALQSGLRALNIANELNRQQLKQDALLNLTIAYRKLGEYDSSLKYALELHKSYQHQGKLNKLASATLQVALIYDRLEQYESSKKFYQTVLDLPRNEVSRHNLGAAARGIANVLYKSGQQQQALSYTHTARQQFSDDGSKSGTQSVAHLQGLIYSSLGDTSNALNAFNESLNLARQLKSRLAEANTLISIGNLLADSQPEQAKKNIENAIAIAKERNLKVSLQRAYDAMAEVNNKQGKYKQAYKFSALEKSIAQEIYEENIAQRITDLKIVTEIADKKRQIELLERQAQISDLKISSQRVKLELLNRENTISRLKLENSSYVRMALIIASLVIFLFLIIVYARFRYIKNLQQLLHQKNQQFKAKQKSLEESHFTKDRLLSMVAQDLRSPISNIIELSTSLYEKIDSTPREQLKVKAKALIDTSSQTYTLIEDLLEWVLTQVRNSEPVPKVYSLEEITTEAIELVSTTASAKNIALTSTVGRGTTVYADKNMIKTVIRNILIYAIKYADKNGYIEISTNEDPTSVTLHIKDSGVGIPKENLDQVFVIDKRLSTTGTQGEIGTDLGLALCREFIEKNGGKIGIDNTEEEGNDFYFSLLKIQPSS